MTISHKQKLMIVGQNMKAARIHAGLTEIDMAERMGVDVKDLIALENGESDQDICMLLEAASICGISPDQLLTGTEHAGER